MLSISPSYQKPLSFRSSSSSSLLFLCPLLFLAPILFKGNITPGLFLIQNERLRTPGMSGGASSNSPARLFMCVCECVCISKEGEGIPPDHRQVYYCKEGYCVAQAARCIRNPAAYYIHSVAHLLFTII